MINKIKLNEEQLEWFINYVNFDNVKQIIPIGNEFLIIYFSKNDNEYEKYILKFKQAKPEKNNKCYIYFDENCENQDSILQLLQGLYPSYNFIMSPCIDYICFEI